MTDKKLLKHWICKYNCAKDSEHFAADEVCRNYWRGKKNAYSGVIMDMADKLHVRIALDDIGYMVIAE